MPVVAIDRQPHGVAVDTVLVDNVHAPSWRPPTASTVGTAGSPAHRPAPISTAVQRCALPAGPRRSRPTVTEDLIR